MEEIKAKVIIIGSGCAGNTAAIYSARAGLEPLVFEGKEPGGQISLTSLVENFPGFPDGINGFELVYNMKKQAIKFGAKYIMEEVIDIEVEKRPFIIKTNSANKLYKADSVIIATGARARLLNVKGEKDYFGKGVSCCATCDGAFYKDKIVVVVGGGDTAMEDALFLTRFAKEIHVMHRRDKLRASKILQERAMNNPKIKIHWNTQILEYYGEQGKLKGVKTVYHPEGKPLEKIEKAGSIEKAGVEVKDFPCDGVFLAIGHVPNTDFLKGKLPINNEGYLIPKKDENCPTCDVYSPIPGIFLAGDVVDWKYQQAITAAAMGCKAGMSAEAFLSSEEIK